MDLDRVSDRALSDLRCAVLLAWMMPAVHFRVCSGPEVLVEVSRPPLPPGDERSVLPTCLFYAAVARAHERRKSGLLEMVRREWGDGTDLTVELEAARGEVLPSGVVRIAGGGRLTSALSVALPAAACLRAVEDGPPLTADVLLHGDTALDATLMYVESPEGDKAAATVAAATLEGALARCLVAELTGHLTTAAPDDVSPVTG